MTGEQFYFTQVDHARGLVIGVRRFPGRRVCAEIFTRSMRDTYIPTATLATLLEELCKIYRGIRHGR